MFNSSMRATKTTARFIPPMLLLRKARLPEGAEWLYELKLDGYRALAIKTEGQVHLRSRNNNDFNARYPGILRALANLPDETSSMAKLSRSMKPAGHPSTACKTMAPRARRCTFSFSMC